MSIFKPKRIEKNEAEQKYIKVNITDIRVRKSSQIDDVDVEDLVKSIKACGVLQPVIVRARGDVYELLSGERRYRAAILAGLKSIDAMVTQADEIHCQLLVLAEKLANRPIHYLEQASIIKKAYASGLSYIKIAEAVGLTEAELKNITQYLQLSPRIINMIIDNDIDEEQARMLLTLDDERSQINAIKEIVHVREGTLPLTAKKANVVGRIHDGRILTKPIVDACNKLEASGVKYELSIREEEDEVYVRITIQKTIE